MLKSKPHHKKNNPSKDFLTKYDPKQSTTFQTNQSKINCSNSLCKSNKFETNIDFSEILQRSKRKYGASSSLYYLNDFEENFNSKRTKQKINLNDLSNFKDEQFIQEYYSPKQLVPSLTQLLEYYKYYMNYPILYEKQHFKILYNFYEKKKYLQYKKLKNILNLSDDGSMGSSEQKSNLNNNSHSDKKDKKSNSSTFYIMNMIKTSCNNDQQEHSQSNAFMSLHKQLQTLIEKNVILSRIKSAKVSNQEGLRFPFKKKYLENQFNSKQNMKYKSKKQSANNSYSSKKNQKYTKYSKQISPFTIVPQRYLFSNQTNKLNQEINIQKFKKRHQSNFSVTEIQPISLNSNNFINNKSVKIKFSKKRLNSCEDIFTRLPSKQKFVEKKMKKLKSCDQIKLSHKKNASQSGILDDCSNKFKLFSKNNKKVEQTLTTHNSQMNPFEDDVYQKIKIKKMKKKLKCTSQSSTGSLQKYSRQLKNTIKTPQINQNITNLKQKIKIEKETIKSQIFSKKQKK